MRDHLGNQILGAVHRILENQRDLQRELLRRLPAPDSDPTFESGDRVRNHISHEGLPANLSGVVCSQSDDSCTVVFADPWITNGLPMIVELPSWKLQADGPRNPGIASR
jgi:hypothetical protein